MKANARKMVHYAAWCMVWGTICCAWCAQSMLAQPPNSNSGNQGQVAAPVPATAETQTQPPAADQQANPTNPAGDGSASLPFGMSLKDLNVDMSLNKREIITYTKYSPREPFRSLVDGQPVDQIEKKDRLELMNISDLTLKGIMKVPNGYIAIFVGVNGKSYPVVQGDKVYDGTVLKVENNKVVFQKPEYDVTGAAKGKKIIDVPLHQ